MEIKFIPTTKDLLDTGKTGLRAKVVSYILFISMFYITPICLALVHLVWVRPINVVLIIIMMLIPIAMHFLMRKLVTQSKDSPSMKGEHKYLFQENEIVLEGPGFNNKIEWALLSKCVKSKTTYLLYSGKAPIISIPTRALTDSQKTQLDEMLASKGLK